MASTWGAAVRAVHIKVNPKPLSIVESREFLRVLRQFGEVTMFRHLKHDFNPAPHTYLAIFRHEEAAAKLLKASPLRVTLDPILPDPEAAENHPLKGQAPRTDMPDPKETSDNAHVKKDLENSELEDPEFALDASRRKGGYEEMTRASKILFEALDSIDVRREEQEDVSFDALLRGTKRAAALSAEEPAAKEDKEEAPPPLPSREFDISVDVSDRNHRDAVSSQVFWSMYTPRVRSPSYLDLVSKGVSPNIADVSTHAQPPSRVFEKIRKHAESKPTLKQIYDAGPGGAKLLAEWTNKMTKKNSPRPETKFRNAA